MAALSDFHRTKSGSDRHTSHAGMEQFQDNKWKNFALQSVKKWRNFHNLMIQRYSKDKICILQYEDLVMDVIHELRETKHFERKKPKVLFLASVSILCSFSWFCYLLGFFQSALT